MRMWIWNCLTWLSRTSLVVQGWRTCLPMKEVQETRVRFLDQEDPLEEEMATHSSILAWRIPWTEKPSGLQAMGSPRVGHHWTHVPAQNQKANKQKMVKYERRQSSQCIIKHCWFLACNYYPGSPGKKYLWKPGFVISSIEFYDGNTNIIIVR